MNFKDYYNNANNIDTQKLKDDEGRVDNTTTINNVNNSKCCTEEETRRIEETIEKYSSYSSEELLQEYLGKTAQSKASGKYSEEKMNKIKEAILPMLNDEQKKYLDQLLDMVK